MSTSNSFERLSSSASFGCTGNGDEGDEVEGEEVKSSRSMALSTTTPKSEACKRLVIDISDSDEEEDPEEVGVGGEVDDVVVDDDDDAGAGAAVPLAVMEAEQPPRRTRKASVVPVGERDLMKSDATPPRLQKHVFMSSKKKKAAAAGLEVKKYPTVARTSTKGVKRKRNGPARLANLIHEVNEKLKKK